MATNTNLLNDVLHSENHSKLSAEQIAKAVARHNKDHSAAKAANVAAKATKSAKKYRQRPVGDEGPSRSRLGFRRIRDCSPVPQRLRRR